MSRESYPAIIMPPETPDTRAQLYILLKVSKLHRMKEGKPYAMTKPLSCKKKISAIERGAIVSAAPDPKPIRILEAKKLP